MKHPAVLPVGRLAQAADGSYSFTQGEQSLNIDDSLLPLFELLEQVPDLYTLVEFTESSSIPECPTVLDLSDMGLLLLATEELLEDQLLSSLTLLPYSQTTFGPAPPPAPTHLRIAHGSYGAEVMVSDAAEACAEAGRSSRKNLLSALGTVELYGRTQLETRQGLLLDLVLLLRSGLAYLDIVDDHQKS